MTHVQGVAGSPHLLSSTEKFFEPERRATGAPRLIRNRSVEYYFEEFSVEYIYGDIRRAVSSTISRLYLDNVLENCAEHFFTRVHEKEQVKLLDCLALQTILANL